MSPTKALQREIESSEKRLREVLKPGSCVYTIQYRSKGSYTRWIKVYTFQDDRPVHLCHDVAVYAYQRYANGKHEGVKCQCEPSELVNYLSEKLFGNGGELKHYVL